MAKRAISTTRSPFDYSQNRPIYFQDVRDVAEMENFAAAEGLPNLANFHSGVVGPVGNTMRTHVADWPTATGVPEGRYDFLVWIDSDMNSILTTAQISVFGVATLDMDVQIGSASFTLQFVGTMTQTIIQSASTLLSAIVSTGWVPVTIEFERVSGAAAGRMNWFSMRYEAITPANLPDPSG